MSEEMLITHCSPTLAGMKTGNLFTCPCESIQEIEEQIQKWNQILSPKGVQITLLRMLKDRALIYVYRPKKLMVDIQREDAKCLLREQGYKNYEANACIAELMNRLSTYKEFPHEIGLFLGYPLEDIKGFIEHKGKNCKCVGCWKVYCNEQEARKTFAKYKRCTNIYQRKLNEGHSIEKLVVGA